MHGDAENVPVDALGPAIEILYDALVRTAASR
jgi:acetylornithine deacetylase/succinyl-diaminopimelate desuccinylase-like protein